MKRSYLSFVAAVLPGIVLVLACSSAETNHQTAQAIASGATCMQDVWQQHGNTQTLGCTANDVSIASATNIRALDGSPLAQCVKGQTFSFIADFNVSLTAQGRFDIGLYFATDGDANHDGALTGTCGANIIRPKDPLSGLGSIDFIQLDGAPDTCGDIDGAHNPQIVTVEVDNVLCQDSDADGKLNLPNCTSWRQPGSNEVCQSSNDAFPGSPSKCNCDAGFNVPLLVENGALAVTKTASPLSLPEPGGEFTFTVTAQNTASFTALTIEKICDDRYGTVAGSGCPAGTLGTVNSTDCTIPQVLAPGVTYVCEFKANLIANDPTSDTDTVTASGTDANGGPVSASASAQVAITDVPPTAIVLKSFGSLLCSTVRYTVEVKNTSPTDALTLAQLIDSSFGDVMTVHDGVLATTCAPTSIPVGANSTCTFDAQFCGGTDTDTVTATLDDGEGNTIKPPSNTLTVNVSAN